MLTNTEGSSSFTLWFASIRSHQRKMSRRLNSKLFTFFMYPWFISASSRTTKSTIFSSTPFTRSQSTPAQFSQPSP